MTCWGGFESVKTWRQAFVVKARAAREHRFHRLQIDLNVFRDVTLARHHGVEHDGQFARFLLHLDDVAVAVNVSGQAFTPQFEFSSPPGLPQDEIVSRILFGSSIARLSALEAVQLAQSLNALNGSGGGLNPLGRVRSLTGVDRLRLLAADEANGRGTALAAGQYISDDVYVEVITDARGFTATQLEISLTPTLSVLSQAGGNGGTNVNLRYRKDY